MSGLGNLVRVHQWILDEKRQRLAGLQQLLDRFRDDLDVLEQNLEAEKEAAARSIDGALAFQTFIPAALERRDKLRNSIENLEREVEMARDDVGAAFQELKKFETAQEIQERHESDQRRRRDQITLDEMGAGIHRRGRAAGEKG